MTQGFSLDKATIMERLGGDEEIFTVMADMYLQDVDGYCRELAAALALGDALRLQREAHTAKGLLATFADDGGAELALALEHQARSGGDLAHLTGSVAALQDRLHLVAAAVRQALAS